MFILLLSKFRFLLTRLHLSYKGKCTCPFRIGFNSGLCTQRKPCLFLGVDIQGPMKVNFLNWSSNLLSKLPLCNSNMCISLCWSQWSWRFTCLLALSWCAKSPCLNCWAIGFYNSCSGLFSIITFVVGVDFWLSLTRKREAEGYIFIISFRWGSLEALKISLVSWVLLA